jgi:hypothetical protein
MAKLEGYACQQGEESRASVMMMFRGVHASSVGCEGYGLQALPGAVS